MVVVVMLLLPSSEAGCCCCCCWRSCLERGLQAACTAASAAVGEVALSNVASSTPSGVLRAMRPNCRCLLMAT